jgi:hypothetical protein
MHCMRSNGGHYWTVDAITELVWHYGIHALLSYAVYGTQEQQTSTATSERILAHHLAHAFKLLCRTRTRTPSTTIWSRVTENVIHQMSSFNSSYFQNKFLPAANLLVLWPNCKQKTAMIQIHHTKNYIYFTPQNRDMAELQKLAQLQTIQPSYSKYEHLEGSPNWKSNHSPEIHFGP